MKKIDKQTEKIYEILYYDLEDYFNLKYGIKNNEFIIKEFIEKYIKRSEDRNIII